MTKATTASADARIPEARLLKGGHATSRRRGFLPLQRVLRALPRSARPRGAVRANARYANAPTPVISRPTISVCIVSVPSYVWIASMSAM